MKKEINSMVLWVLFGLVIIFAVWSYVSKPSSYDCMPKQMKKYFETGLLNLKKIKSYDSSTGINYSAVNGNKSIVKGKLKEFGAICSTEGKLIGKNGKEIKLVYEYQGGGIGPSPADDGEKEFQRRQEESIKNHEDYLNKTKEDYNVIVIKNEVSIP